MWVGVGDGMGGGGWGVITSIEAVSADECVGGKDVTCYVHGKILPLTST